MREWQYGWWRDFTVVESHGKDTICQLPTGEFFASLNLGMNDFFNHGPFKTIEEARPCCQGKCECWKKENKEKHQARRYELAAMANSY